MDLKIACKLCMSLSSPRVDKLPSVPTWAPKQTRTQFFLSNQLELIYRLKEDKNVVPTLGVCLH